MLDYRTRQVEEVQLRLAVEEQTGAQLKQHLEGIRVSMAQAQKDVLTPYQSVGRGKATFNVMVDMTQLRSGLSAYLQRMREEEHITEKYIGLQQQRINQVKAELTQALVKQKSLNLLKEKQEKAWQKEMERVDQLNLEEISSNLRQVKAMEAS